MLPATSDQAESDELATLLGLAARGDGEAFRRLYDRESPRLYAVALRITRQPALAADAVHDAMLQVWRNAARFDPARDNARAWLLSLVRYRALEVAARTRREGTGAEPDPDPEPLARLLETQAGQALHRCLQQAPEEGRQWLVLAFLDGLTHREVAARVGQPLGTVKSGIRRGLLALRTCLDGASA
ncbi:MAG TPA: sigma-70 family RNA polymerase sigma factor [Acetobacteraceae bacterium]|nr:sigma-70 family RNA polymerase sigma factor [Acetobacteraceae bacterium]